MFVPFWLTMSLCAVPGEHEDVIDAFQFRDVSTARRAWVASDDTPAVQLARDGSRSVFQFQAPFGSDSELPRTILDRDVRLDLSGAGGFRIELNASAPEAIAHLSVYFRSGHGWYGANAPISSTGWQTVRLPKSAFRTEEKPIGWNKIDGIRISVWRGKPVDTTVWLRRLVAVWHDIALIVPASVGKSDGDGKSVLQVSGQVGTMLTELGLSPDRLDDKAVARGALGQRRLAILAYAPQLDDKAVAALDGFLKKGGKLFACYTLPKQLLPALGLRSLSYYRPDEPGKLAEIRFNAAGIPGLPRSVRQASWNINAPEVQGRGARVIGSWYDREGKPTGHSAMVVSDTGAFFSHILLADDRDAKKRLLAAVLGHLHPPLWPQMAQTAIERVGHVGHLNDLASVSQYVSTSPQRSRAWSAFQAAMQAEQGARQQFARRAYADAVTLAQQAHEQLVQAYLRATPSRPVEGRAFWNHSGTGVYPGDWERTAKELAAAGINMIVPNMLWAGRAHYASQVLPRSETYKKYGDQIAQCVRAAHEHGIEVHVWKVNHNLSGAPAEFVQKLKSEGRLQVSRTGQSYNWLCPSDTRNFQLELESMLEVVRNYDVDGLHFDYIRYPNGDHCYCPGCRERFQTQTGHKVAHWPEDCYSGPLRDQYRQWRCDQITRLVAAVHDRAKKLRPRVQISAAVFGSYPNCRNSVGQDWVAWTQAGYLDFICPMDYTQSDQAFRNLVSDQIRLVRARVPIYPGVGAFRLTPDRTIGQIQIARELGTTGFTIFNLEPNTAESLLSALSAGVGARRAVLPHRKP